MHRFNDKIWVITPDELSQLPDGTELISIFEEKVVKGKDYIDDDTRFGYLAYGVADPIMEHAQAEYFTKFKLEK